MNPISGFIRQPRHDCQLQHARRTCKIHTICVSPSYAFHHNRHNRHNREYLGFSHENMHTRISVGPPKIHEIHILPSEASYVKSNWPGLGE